METMTQEMQPSVARMLGKCAAKVHPAGWFSKVLIAGVAVGPGALLGALGPQRRRRAERGQRFAVGVEGGAQHPQRGLCK